MQPSRHRGFPRGVTLIELVIVVAVMGVLLSVAIPSYRSYMIRVHRTEAVRLLLQAAQCQQRIMAIGGQYDTGRCRPGTSSQHYRLDYDPISALSDHFVVTSTPVGVQDEDSCGSLTLDQNGNRGISATGISVSECWNGR